MGRGRLTPLRVVTVAVDVLAAGMSVIAVHALGADTGPHPALAVTAAVGVWLVLLSLARAHDRSVLGLSPAEYERIGRAGLWSLLVLALFARWLHLGVAVGLVAGAAGLTLAGRLALRLWLRHRVRIGRHQRRLLAVGPAAAASGLAATLARLPDFGITVIGLATDDAAAGDAAGPWPVLGPVEAAPVLALELGADVIAVAAPTAAPDVVPWLLRSTDEDGAIAVLLEASDLEAANAAVAADRAVPARRVAPAAPVVQVEGAPLQGLAWSVKSWMDRIGALALLVLLSPVLAAVALVVKLDSPGPVLFRQPRAGRGGRPFAIVKFRTMRVDAEQQLAELKRRTAQEGPFFKLEDDPRITPAGHWLRRLSLDELPQLWNVVRGDMSLVGPRPLPLREAEWFSAVDRRRTVVRPGITGLWQISGRSLLSADDAVRLDLAYIADWSLRRDLVILLRTVSVVVRRSGAA